MEIAAVCIAVVLVLIVWRLYKIHDEIREITKAQCTLLLLATNAVSPVDKQKLSERLSRMFNVSVVPEDD